jgi:hypothetical protein
MDLDTLIITVFDRLDEAVKAALKERPLRQRGPKPTLTDTEVLTMEVIGAYLGFSEETALYAYFRQHYAHFFPSLRKVHRTTFTRQMANLWKLKETVWLSLLDRETSLQPYVIVDSLPLPVCRFARAYRCQRFSGEADYGHDWVARQTFYGFRLHALVGADGLIRTIYLTPASADEKDALEDMTEGKVGKVIGDRNFWSPHRKAHWEERGLKVLAPFKRKSTDPDPKKSFRLSHLRYQIETVFSQLTERFKVKVLRAKDLWHLMSRLMRSVLSHTVSSLLYRSLGESDLKFARLLSQ